MIRIFARRSMHDIVSAIEHRKGPAMKKTLALTALTLAAATLTGCGGFQTASQGPAQLAIKGIHGSVFGGRQPVAGASLQIYQAGTTGYGTGATGLITSNQTTDATGQFNITGDYTCTAGTELYLVAVGGKPTPGVTNASSVLMAGLGDCTTVSAGIGLQMNEVTTVATVWALAPFMNPTLPATTVVNQTGAVTSAGINIGSPSATNLAAAFADINTLVNIGTGYAGATTPSPSVAVPTNEIYALANILAGCIDGDGTQAGCTQLYTYSTVSGSAPHDTYSAALSIARNPGNNAMNLLTLSNTFAPYATTLASVNDWTIGVAYTGSGLSSPSGVAVDATGNVWVTNAANNSVTELSHNGTVLSGANGFTAGSLNSPSAIAIDTAGNAWITNAGNNTLTELTSTGANASGSPFTGGGLNVPASIAFDGQGNSWIANSGANSVSEFSPTGTALSGASGYTSTGASTPIGVALNPR